MLMVLLLQMIERKQQRGYVGYIEEKAKIDNFTLSLGGRFEYMKMHYRDKAATMGTTSNLEEEIYAFAPGGGIL